MKASEITVSSALLLWSWAAGMAVAMIYALIRTPHFAWNPQGIGLVTMIPLLGGGSALVWKYRARFAPVLVVPTVAAYLTVVALSIPFTLFVLHRAWWAGVAWIALSLPFIPAIRGGGKP